LEEVFKVLRAQRLFGKLEKCEFFSPQVTFLGYVVPKMISPWIKPKWKLSSHGQLAPPSPKLGVFMA